MEWNPIGGTSASLGSALGRGIAAPINQALEILGQKKLMEIQQAQKMRAQQAERERMKSNYSNIFGDQVADLLVNLPESVQKSAFGNIGGLFDLGRQLGGTMNAGQMPNILQEQQVEQQAEPEQQTIKPDFANIQQNKLKEQLAGQKQNQIESLLQDTFTPENLKLARKKDIRDQQKMEQQAEQFQKKQTFAEKKLGYDETRKFREEMDRVGEESDNTLALLARQKKLNDSGNLAHPMKVDFLRKLGLDWALNPDSQEFAGLEKEFLKGARSVFGGRVTNFEMTQFLRGIPTLMQTKEGRDRIIRNLQIMAQLKKAKSRATEKILAKYEYPPANLANLVAEKSKKKRDRLLSDFVTGGETLKILPNPETNKGRLLKTPDGNWQISNGKKWKDISQEEVDRLTGMQEG